MTIEREMPDEFSGLAQLFHDGEDWSGRPDGPTGERRRARRRRALIITGLAIVLVVAAIGGYAGWALNAPLSAPTVNLRTPSVPVPAAAALALPSEGASAISITGADAYFAAAPTRLTLTSGSNAPRPMASISKLITALVVLDAHPLASASAPGPTITFGKADHDLYDQYYVMGATIAAMPTGSRMSLHDALATMLIPSASNYAVAVSTWAFGSQGAFLAAARRWLAAHGLHHTTMVEPTGVSAQNTSTPGDLLALGRLAAANPTIAAIAATSSLSLPGPGSLSNTNDLLGTDGITGLKTGNLGDGTFDLLYTASLNVGLAQPLQIVGVLLGAGTRASADADVTAELNSIEAGFHMVTVATAGQQIGTETTPWGATARVVVQDGTSLFMWSDTPIAVSLKTTTSKAGKTGGAIGTLTWKAGPATATSAVVVHGRITPPTAWWRLTHPAELGRR